jgi:hypothetical protein
VDITALLLAVCAVRVVVSLVFTFVSSVHFCIGMIARLPKKMFGSSLHPFVLQGVHVLFTCMLVVFT